jgi:dTDP-4-dehydrorhamnose reductase
MGKRTRGPSRKGRLLVTGAQGLLGREIVDLFRGDYDVVATDRPECDVTSGTDCRRAVASARPDVVVHCAAFTAVDRAESDEEAAFAVNALGTMNVARACREHEALIVTFGTDYVFDGTATRPYREEDDPRPLSAYGRSKLAAEVALREETQNFLLIRTQWLFGPHGRNFIFAVLDRAKREGALAVVDDQAGCPTYARDLADATRRLLDAKARGTYHFSNEGHTTFFGYASYVLSQAVTEAIALTPLASAELPRDRYPAPRPAYSVLSKEKYRSVTGSAPRRWEDAVRDFLGTLYVGGVAW